MREPKKIIISRTDNIGDVVLTLPMAGTFKSKFPGSKIYFIGKTYTAPVIISSQFVDEFIDRETVLKNPSSLTNIRLMRLFMYSLIKK